MLELIGKISDLVHLTDGLSTSACFSPDGTKLAIVDGLSVVIYDISSGEVFQTILTSHVKSISQVCWSPDGQCVATASDDFTINVLHLLYGQLYILMGHTAPVISLCYNSKGNLLCSSSMDESIKIWDTLNGTLMRTISAHSEAVVSIDICTFDSSILSSGSFDGLIRIFDTATGHCLKTLTYDKDWKRETGVVPISQVKFSKNAKFLLVKSLDGVVKIWDCVRGNVVRTFPLQDDNDIDTNKKDGEEQIDNKQQGKQLKQMNYSCGMDFLYPEDDDKPPIVISGYDNGEIYCWDTSDKKLLQLLKSDEYHKDSPIISIDCHGSMVCSLSLNGECYLWTWK
ncbi:hypothetical protein Kpol_1048p38 [Vanderwaltozyma polyspora DSM 70294]|uniref:Uncharacterized protein n=1 Tax=Vanderwaltozyma polyspora (strain ATCC 22028 / DSM 70294 / BCRC 21397 / CBS 2163 / NBRC 10782 / NRRL Y-8283 / UCD 57-17) TaxID=436907 RepID=A7TGK0_VANPO|nr:uncharacterized protein Kpol_1048p38 [Vanderwaltozyma polyspora DSM 70294]EDO18607.1 hypothetical protein Kpol_1048p38 [Vanderwaltozyma polyspora DSM 70294]